MRLTLFLALVCLLSWYSKSTGDDITAVDSLGALLGLAIAVCIIQDLKEIFKKG